MALLLPFNWSCQPVSSSTRKLGGVGMVDFSTDRGRGSGRKSGAVRRIAFLNSEWGPRRACIRPLSSGEPSTRRSMECTNKPISRNISPSGSEDGGFGSRERSWLVCSNSLLSSSSISGSLPNVPINVRIQCNKYLPFRYQTGESFSEMPCELLCTQALLTQPIQA